MTPPDIPDGFEVVEERRSGGRKWIEPRFTLGNLASIIATVLLAAMIYYGIIGKMDSQAADIDQLQEAVAPLPSLSAHVQIIDNTITLNKASRDKQNDDMSARLDRLTDAVNSLAQSNAALNATIKATEDRRP